MHKQKGFTAVEIILAVIAVLILGFIGWRVWDAQQQANKEADQALQQAEQKTEQTQQPSNQAPAATVKYLEFKELGAKIKLSDDIKDATYAYRAESNSVELSTQTLTDKSGGDCRASNGPLGAISKSKTLTDATGNPMEMNDSLKDVVRKFGDDYFRYYPPQGTCSADQSVVNLLLQQKQSVVEAFKTIELMQ